MGWDELLEQLARRCSTTRGAQLAQALRPCAHLDDARARQAEISEARALIDRGTPLQLEGVKDLGETLSRAGRGGVLSVQELRDVGVTLTVGAQARRLLLQHELTPRLRGRAALITELLELASDINESFEDGEPPRVADRASSQLGGLRRRALKVHEELERLLQKLIDSSAMSEYLQDRFFTQREDRYVLPVCVESRARVRGIVHGTSASGQTVFVEPEEVIELNNRKRLSELEVAEEERRVLAELSRRVADQLPQLLVNLEVLTALDLSSAMARLATDLSAAAPELSEAGPLDLRRARHPLMVLRGQTVVGNDICIDFGHALVISGPNAGGKTVALRLAGLSALMALSGLHVPAQEGSRFPFFHTVLSDVGDDQSLAANLSTFSAHVAELRACLRAAQPGVLVLLDEVGGGTDPVEGAALAQAVLEALCARLATTIVTTHYDRLKALAAQHDSFKNAAVGFDLSAMQPTFQLHSGVPGASGAVVMARRLQLDEKVCARATELLGETRAGLEQLLVELDQKRRSAENERAMAEEERKQASRVRAEAEEKAKQAEQHLARVRAEVHDEAVESLREAQRQLDHTRSVLRRSGGKITPAEVGAAKAEIEAARKRVHEAAPAPPEKGRAARAEELRAGVTVWVVSLSAKATVLAPPKGGKVSLMAGPIKSTVPVGELRILENQAPSAADKPRSYSASAPSAPASTRGAYHSLDVRGERTDVALGICEKFLDDALRAELSEVLLIHGHGSGALRDQLRARLREFPGVAGIRPGTPDEGGDGVTVITFA